MFAFKTFTLLEYCVHVANTLKMTWISTVKGLPLKKKKRKKNTNKCNEKYFMDTCTFVQIDYLEETLLKLTNTICFMDFEVFGEVFSRKVTAF